ncbi:MAG: MarR family transcriptional regulator [Candidatus Thorarchaeota archaeon]
MRRLSLDPSLRQADLARELGISRSAVNQVWKRLEQERNLIVRGNMDLGRLGLQLIFGWASGLETSDVLDKFSRWLHTNSLVSRMTRSVMSSTMDGRIYFEAIVPLGDQHTWFTSQVARFQKRPYSLSVSWSTASTIAYSLNPGLYDGEQWRFSNDFRLEASIGAAKSYVDVLPVVNTVSQSKVQNTDLSDIVVASAIEKDFHATGHEVRELFETYGVSRPSDRTIRRKLEKMRGLATPYVHIDRVGLNQKLLVCLKDPSPGGSPLSRLLHAQVGTFPKAHIVSGGRLTVLDLEIPDTVDWLTMSQILSTLSGNTSEICTFIANRNDIEKRLENVVSLIAQRTPDE